MPRPTRRRARTRGCSTTSDACATRPGANPARLRIWVHDASDGRWMNGFEAVLVAAPSIRTPMGGGMLAYRDPAAADRAAARHNGRVIRSIDDILRKERGL